MSEQQEDTIERNKFVYELVNSWIGNADNKVSVSCGIFTGVFGVITFLTENYIKVPESVDINNSWSCIYKIAFVLSLAIMAAAIYFYARAIIPNLKSNSDKPTDKKYPIYYGDIKSLSPEKFVDLMESGTNEDFNDELVKEIHFNSRICLRKMERYRIGVILSLFAIGMAFVSFIAHFLMYR